MTFLDRARRFLATRRYAYQATFKGPLAEQVLADLADFCFARSSTFHKDMTREQCLTAQGRREVWLRIAHHLNLTEDQLWQFYDGRQDVSE